MPDVLGGDHGKCPVHGEQEAVDEARLARGRQVPRSIVEVPGGSQDGQRKSQRAKGRLQHRALREQIVVGGVRADGRQAKNLRRLGCCQRRSDAVDHGARFGIAGLGVELRGRQDEHRFGPTEGGRQRRRVRHLGDSDRAAERGPRFTFLRITHDGAHRLAGSEEGACELAADLARDSCDCVHLDPPIHGVVPEACLAIQGAV